MQPSWSLVAVDEAAVVTLAGALGVKRLTARLLLARGLGDPVDAAAFLAPRLADLRPPDGIADLDRALDRLARAVAGHERVGVFGDYDADGVTTAAILTLTLRAFGAEVVPRVASRHAGYGFGPADAARFCDDGCRVVVTGDCGTSDIESLRLCRERGVDVIVIDHHQVPSGESPAYALINPHRPDDRFPWKGLASCGVAFYIAAALRTRLRDASPAAAAFDPRDLLDLVALGTIADVVPLQRENRILVAQGLRVLGARRRAGLRALGVVAGLPGAQAISARDVSFRLTPRLNAAGRVGEAQAALDLLLAADDAEAGRRAQILDDTNQERQRLQEAALAEAVPQGEAEAAAGAPAIVVGGDGWHAGVVGIVAAKLLDRHQRPIVVVGFDGNEGRGSARTIAGFDLYQALSACREHLARWGGHAAAAGLTVTRERWPAFRAAFLAESARRLAAHEAPALMVDAEADLRDVDVAQVEEIERLAPFGAANAEPLLALRGVTARRTRVVGKDHLQISLAGAGASAEAIAFGMADRDPGSGAPLDVLAHAQLDVYRGERRARLRVKHLYRVASGHD